MFSFHGCIVLVSQKSLLENWFAWLICLTHTLKKGYSNDIVLQSLRGLQNNLLTRSQITPLENKKKNVHYPDSYREMDSNLKLIILK